MNEYKLPIGTAKKLHLLGVGAGLGCVIEFLEALEQYATDGTLPEEIDPYVRVLLNDALPANDKARKKAEAGKRGGSKTQANAKQTASKRQAERKEEQERKESTPIPPKESKGEVEKKYINTSCAEPEIPVITFPLNDGTDFAVTEETVATLSELYPAVNTMQTLREIKGWCIANPTKRKTRRGALRFVHSWFAKEQDRGPKTTPAASKPHRPTPEETYALPAINPWALPGEGTR